MAVTWGTPIPVTILVVQIEPGPIPTFIPSAPASTSALAPSPVATLPPITSTSGKFFLIHLTRLRTFKEWPWAVSTTRTSTLAWTRAATLSSVPSPTLTEAPTIKRPWSSLHAFGYCSALSISVTVINPLSSKSSLMTNTFSILCLCNNARTSSAPAPSLTVTSFSFGVITEVTEALMSVANLTSRRVTIPTKFPFSRIGTPEILFASVSALSCSKVADDSIVNGSLTTPLSYFFTAQTSLAWSSIDILLWTMPTPPSWAIAIARRDSVTVSIAADISGMFMIILRVSWVCVVTSFAVTSEYPGTKRTSSKVSASFEIRNIGTAYLSSSKLSRYRQI